MHSTIFATLGLSVIANAFVVVAETSDHILFIGDSWASACPAVAIENVCPFSTFTQRGVTGSTAKEWAGSGSSGTTSIDEALQASGNLTTSVWVSLGGNDLLHSGGCSPSVLQDIETNIATIVNRITQTLPNTHLFMTGYGWPAIPLPEVEKLSGCKLSDFLVFRASLEKIAAQHTNVTFHDIVSIFGGSETNPSSTKYYEDSIHLNFDGYIHLFSQPDILKSLCVSQAAFTDIPRRNQTSIHQTTEASIPQDGLEYQLMLVRLACWSFMVIGLLLVVR